MTTIDSGLELLAIDPGGTTGWAHFWIPTANLLGRSLDILEDVEYDCGQLTGSEPEQAMQIRPMLEEMSGTGPVICEDFILRQFRQDAALLSPVRLMAMIEFMVSLINEPPPFKKQQPSLAKSTATDERLKDWGLWEKGAPHARDAIRHGVTFLRRAKTDNRLRNWAWPHVNWEVPS
jgi:hypothetical protein